MPFRGIQTKAQNDAVGPGSLNIMRSNILYLRSLLDYEHLSTGEHNAQNIPRVCRRITGAAVINPSPSADITAATNPATGQYTLTLAANRFTTEGMRLQISPIGEVGVYKPAIATYTINSATSVDVWIKRLTSTLGSAGNAWAATNMAFDVAIHGAPLAQTAWTEMRGGPWRRANAVEGYGLMGGGDQTNPNHWSGMVRQMAVLQSALTAEHTGAGAHDSRHIAKYASNVVFTTGPNKYAPANGLLNCTYVSSGVFDIDYSAIGTPVSVFVCPDYSRTAGGTDRPTIINVNPDYTAGTVSRVHCYQWNAGSSWWETANMDLFIAIHGD